MASDPNEFTPEQLQEQLAAYQQALKEEFETKLKNVAPENAETYIKTFFRENLGAAVAQVVWLAQNAESETVKLNASKMIIAEALADARADGDPLKKLLSELTKKKAVQPKGSSTDN